MNESPIPGGSDPRRTGFQREDHDKNYPSSITQDIAQRKLR